MRRGAAEHFTVPFEGRGVHFCRQNAAQRLSHRQRACAMMPRLGKRGLGGEEAYALAYNCVLLWQTLDGPDRLRTPAGALRRALPPLLGAGGPALRRGGGGRLRPGGIFLQ